MSWNIAIRRARHHYAAGGLRRGDCGEVVPRGDTLLQGADVLLVGRHDALREARSWLERPA